MSSAIIECSRQATAQTGLLLIGQLLVCLHLVSAACAADAEHVIDIGGRRELFVDSYLIQSMSRAQFKLHAPKREEEVLLFNAPWEGAFSGYVTVLNEDGLFRLYYRGLPSVETNTLEVTCYAESRDGIHWTKPPLKLIEIDGYDSSNTLLSGPIAHNFSPFIDPRVPKGQFGHFKALAGTHLTGGLFAFASDDGLHWRRLAEEPVFVKGGLDSQNVAFWTEAEGCYVCYFRLWKGKRTVGRMTSKDFLEWTEPVFMHFGDTPAEELYTNQTHPYFRAPHIYVATPMRFVPGRKVISSEQEQALQVHKDYASDCADVVFMTSRGGPTYTRTFMEAWIRPGPLAGNWVSRAAMAALGVVQTGEREMSVYKQENYAQPTARLVRYSLRLDGFISINAGYESGSFQTRPLRFSGKKVVVNYSTAAAGHVRVELQDAHGIPIPGFTLTDAAELVGDAIEQTVSWKDGSDVGGFAGKPIRLKVVLADADIYSMQFR